MHDHPKRQHLYKDSTWNVSVFFFPLQKVSNGAVQSALIGIQDFYFSFYQKNFYSSPYHDLSS